MAASDPQPAAKGSQAASAEHGPSPGAYHHLPDLSADISMDTENVTRPTFEQLNAALISRGYLRSPLNVTGMREESLVALSDTLHAMVAQREEDIEVRTALTAKNRSLTASLERTKRFQKEELERSADLERKVEASKAKLLHLATQLDTERNAQKAAKEALGRMRRDLQAIKASALQYKAANDRSVARVRARIGEVTGSAIRSAVPDFQIVASAFDDVPTTSTPKASATALYVRQVQELEQKRAHLVEYNQALKRFATEAINAIRRADQELVDMVEAEEDDVKRRDPSSTAKPNSESSNMRSVSSSNLSGNAAVKRLASTDAWLYGHRPLFQRDLFPANDTFRSTSSGAFVSASSSKTQHPALRALELTSTAVISHVQSLLDLRTERTIHEAAQSQRLSAEAREQVWAAELEQVIQEDLRSDARLSLNKMNGPIQGGSLASAAIAASSGSSGGGASHRIDWQKEKIELEKKLAQLVKQVALAEENAVRNGKQARRLAEAEKSARSLLEQASCLGSAKDEGAETSPDALQEAERLKAELHAVEHERDRYAKRCEMLEAEAQELRSERERVLSAHSGPLACTQASSSELTSLKRLDEGEMAKIHALDQKHRKELSHLSVVAENSEVQPLTEARKKAEIGGKETVESTDAATSHASVRKERSNRGSADTGTISFGESFGNNPELDSIFGVKRSSAVANPKRDAAPRRSSRLSGGSADAEAVTPIGDEPTKASESGTRKRKAGEEDPSPLMGPSSAGRRRASRRLSNGKASKTDFEELSSHASKQTKAEHRSSSSLESVTVGQDASSEPVSETLPPNVARSSRRLSTREKEELDRKHKRKATTSDTVQSKTPASTSRRIVSASSSVSRPTVASLSRSEALQTSAKRPLSNATNTRQSLTQALRPTKAHARVVSSASIRARS
ncbi:uncharacterized protein MEPE_06063 [Melanopsichium pennsylvanicum]|uniref:Uncharacterized protein n=1 Tax=Melanopsichium pennsylvanicum TaxID=63383 RepID=A0AAJ4XU07_9BASI|nr:uncharacterized protein MEPE_06063 [Melanopsichium pennsylvanicum]